MRLPKYMVDRSNYWNLDPYEIESAPPEYELEFDEILRDEYMTKTVEDFEPLCIFDKVY